MPSRLKNALGHGTSAAWFISAFPRFALVVLDVCGRGRGSVADALLWFP
jgi:hypothetical protein